MIKRVLFLLALFALPGAAAAAKKKKGAVRSSWPQPTLGGSASGQPEVLFTFDDGPGGRLTDELLDTLRARRVHAIFFLVGSRVSGGKAKAQQQIQRILDEGHAVGNHTQSHKDLCLASQASRIDKEIDDSRNLIQEAAGIDVLFFRAPFGVRCEKLETALATRGLFNLHWDIDPQEWRARGARNTERHLIARLGELPDGHRAVVLAHDTRAETVRSIPVVLDWIDQENARRRAAGRKEIRIIDPAEIALEKMIPGVPRAAGDAAAAVETFGDGLFRRLVLPLGGVAAAQL